MLCTKHVVFLEDVVDFILLCRGAADIEHTITKEDFMASYLKLSVIEFISICLMKVTLEN